MSRIQSGKLAIGLVLMISFLAVLVAIFAPIIGGDNALNYLDNLFNSISKASAYHIDDLRQDVAERPAEQLALTLELGDPDQARQAAGVLAAAGAAADVDGSSVAVTADLTAILAAGLADADSLYFNRGEEVAARHGGGDPRVVVHAWWQALAALEHALTRDRRFAAAKLTHTIKTKAVECAYNYYGIEPQPISQRWGIVLFSLVFYVVYTVWYGYVVMYLFEGVGYRLSH